MNDSHVISMIAKLSTSHFRLSSQPPQIDLLQSTHSLSSTVTALAQLLHWLLYAAHAQSDQASPLHVLYGLIGLPSYSKVALPLKYNLK